MSGAGTEDLGMTLTRTLEEELAMRATYDDDPPNSIVLDELENNYQRLRNV